MQLETTHLSGAVRFNEVFAAWCRPLLLPPRCLPSSDAQGKASGASSARRDARSLFSSIEK